jgi:hypothetical protein
MEQVEILGTQVVPELRKIAAARKPAHVPDAPTHASRLAAATAHQAAANSAAPNAAAHTAQDLEVSR